MMILTKQQMVIQISGMVFQSNLNKTTNGNPNFWDGFPIKLENMKTKKVPKIVPKKTTAVFKL